MSDPNRCHYRNWFKRDFLKALERLAPLKGQLSWGEHDYEAFIFERKGLKLIFYPHRTSAGNYHIRVRSSSNSDGRLVREAVFALAENSCTFQYPTDTAMHHEAVTAALRRGDPNV